MKKKPKETVVKQNEYDHRSSDSDLQPKKETPVKFKARKFRQGLNDEEVKANKTPVEEQIEMPGTYDLFDYEVAYK